MSSFSSVNGLLCGITSLTVQVLSLTVSTENQRLQEVEGP